MLTLRKAEDRGHTDLGWLSSFHTFSFGGYNDPNHMGFRSLRVLNDDRVAPGKGFGAHGHRDMEILSYVITGKLAHKDSMGEQHELGPNEVQAMSAGTGVIHSEFNGVDDAETHFLQIWIVPNAKGLKPSYQQFEYAEAEKRGVLRLMAGPDRGTTPAAAFINQDARMYASMLANGQTLELPVVPGRYAWVHCVQGAIEVNGVAMHDGDGLAVSDERALTIRGGAGGGELLLFDLALTGSRAVTVPGVNVLVVFYSRYGRAERLALAVGVGAIEAEANIRLRRLPDDASAETIQSDAAWRESLDRMNRDYVAPRPADPLWADVIVLAIPAESSREVEAYVATLPGLGLMTGKLAAPLSPGENTTCDGVFVAAARAGLISVPQTPAPDATPDPESLTHARLHGQRLVQLARAMKTPLPAN